MAQHRCAEFLPQLTELFIQLDQNAVCVSIWMLTMAAQIVTTAHSDL